MRLVAVIFEGGTAPEDDLEETLVGLRHAVAQDAVEKFRAAGVDEVLVATNFPLLGQAVERLGAQVVDTSDQYPFHFGPTLQRIVSQSGADAVIYTSGAALPLLSVAEIRWICEALRQDHPVVVVNNPQSADLVAWNPAHYIGRVAIPEHDNFLGWLLREQGMERVLIPNSAGVHFDLDTPTDYLVLAVSSQAGPRGLAGLKAVDWPRRQVQAAADILATELPEVAFIGRVGTSVIEHMNRYLRVRCRVLSEERGMKALRREEEGKVLSLVAEMIDTMGPEAFFATIASVCQAIFFDTRPLFAHRGRKVSDWDRYHSDLLQVEQIRDPWVRAFTVAARNCPVPVVLGGHSVVAGGLWVLADRAIALRGGPQQSQAKGFAPA